MFRKRKIVLAVNPALYFSKSLKVAAYTKDGLAIHKKLKDVAHRWTITHIQTGTLIEKDFYKLPDAKLFVEKITRNDNWLIKGAKFRNQKSELPEERLKELESILESI